MDHMGHLMLEAPEAIGCKQGFVVIPFSIWVTEIGVGLLEHCPNIVASKIGLDFRDFCAQQNNNTDMDSICCNFTFS